MLHDNGIPAELCTTPRRVPKEFGAIKRRQWKWKEGGTDGLLQAPELS